MKRSRRKLLLVAGFLVLALALGVTVAFAQTPEGGESLPENDGLPSIGPRGGFGHFGFGGQLEGVTPLDELLADELDVTVEELQNARAEVHAAVMEYGGFGFHGHHGFAGDDDYEALFADALGKDVEELQAAQAAAYATWLDEVVDAGYLTDEEAALIEAKQALKDYIDREVLMASALGIEVDELRAAREAGTPLSELLGEMSFQEFATKMQEAYEAAIQQAVDDNVITDELAEEILSNGFGFHDFGGRRGPGMFGGHGGFRGFGAPSDAAETAGTSL